MTSNAPTAGDQQKNDDPMKQTMLIIEHKIRNLEKRKIKLDGYIKEQRVGILLCDEKLQAASKYNEVISNLDFAKSLKNQLSSLLTKTKQNNQNTDGKKCQTNVDIKIKEVLIFQKILESIKNETVQQDILTEKYGAIQLTNDELLNLITFSKMVSPKNKVEDGKPLFVDQFKTISKHYVKLIDSKPNMIAGTSYANLKECLLKIEKSGYLNYIMKHLDTETKTTNDINKSEIKISKIDHNESTVNTADNISIPDEESVSNKIGTIYFTNNNIAGNKIEQKSQHNNNIASESVFNSSFDFLQDSELDNDNFTSNMNNSMPTQKLSSTYYNTNCPVDDAILKILTSPPQHNIIESDSYKETKTNNLRNILNVSNSNSWTKQSDVNKTNIAGNNLTEEDWSMSQMMYNNTKNDWAVNNNWNEMVESADIQSTKSSQNNISSNFGFVSNDNLNELLQKSVVFNKQESFAANNSSNDSKFYQNNYRQQEHNNIKHYMNSNNNFNRRQSNGFNKRSLKHRGNEGGSSKDDYQQWNNKNRSYINSNQYNNRNSDYSQIPRQS